MPPYARVCGREASTTCVVTEKTQKYTTTRSLNRSLTRVATHRHAHDPAQFNTHNTHNNTVTPVHAARCVRVWAGSTRCVVMENTRKYTANTFSATATYSTLARTHTSLHTDKREERSTQRRHRQGHHTSSGRACNRLVQTTRHCNCMHVTPTPPAPTQATPIRLGTASTAAPVHAPFSLSHNSAPHVTRHFTNPRQFEKSVVCMARTWALAPFAWSTPPASRPPTCR